MVTINYQSFGNKGFQLRLRLYQEGETRYINVTKMLKGKIQSRHWNPKKQQFIPSCPYAQENNDILVRFRQKYDERAIDWNGSLYGFMASFEKPKVEERPKLVMLDDLFEFIINEQKNKFHPDGSRKDTYECYEKTKTRVKDYCEQVNIHYDKLTITDVTTTFLNDMFDWIKNKKEGKGLMYVSKMLHAVMNVADKEGVFDFDSLQGVRWKKKELGSVNKYKTLTELQCKKLEAMKVIDLPRNPKSELYRDFCIFLLYTGQSPCDAITLQYSDIENIRGVDHFIFKRRKIEDKQAVPCAVPINKSMRRIMNRWKNEAKDGYVFPIRNKWKLENQKTSNGDIKHFISRTNAWLKEVAKTLKCDFSLHLYTFRHTAITRYISNGIPVTYVANLMGTSVKNCEQIYYNNQGDIASRDKVLSLLI